MSTLRLVSPRKGGGGGRKEEEERRKRGEGLTGAVEADEDAEVDAGPGGAPAPALGAPAVGFELQQGREGAAVGLCLGARDRGLVGHFFPFFSFLEEEEVEERKNRWAQKKFSRKGKNGKKNAAVSLFRDFALSFHSGKGSERNRLCALEGATKEIERRRGREREGEAMRLLLFSLARSALSFFFSNGSLSLFVSRPFFSASVEKKAMKIFAAHPAAET